MSETLSAVWEQVRGLLSAGVSVIPVRDRQIGDFQPKTPYRLWKKYQEEIISPEELWQQMEANETAAIAIICGKISGNLEAIDIDVKYWPGIDARYFQLIQELDPDLWKLLRIHRSPSGGYHILYRTEQATGDGNQKLAIASNSTQAGIETRAEGGYIVAPPSLGYRIQQDVPIPTISNHRRDMLITLAKSLNEHIKVVEPPKPPNKKTDYYDENPFEHYNRSDAGEQLLIDHGWKQSGNCHHHYVYFTRPGKDGGISASWNRERRLYHIFTSSSALEPDRSYHPATLLSKLQFNGNNRQTYQYLVDQGYGKIKPVIERQLVRSAILADKELPANLSNEGKSYFAETKVVMAERYPGGIYWVQDTDAVVKINRERLYTVAASLGFRLYNAGIVLLDGQIIRHMTERAFYDTLKAYCIEEEADFLEAIRNAFEAFIQRSGNFTITRIPMLEEEHILCSSRYTSYKFYRNGYVHITADQLHFETYDKLPDNTLIWENAILDRDFIQINNEIPIEESLYYQFLDKAIGIIPDLWLLIGYLIHDYKDETMGYIITLIEQCENPKQGGGTGKNLFCNLLSHITSVKNIAGVQVQLNEKFLQAWNYERILVLSDVPKNFHYSFLKEPATGSGTLKKLYKDETIIPSHQMPKIIVSTNYSFESIDGGLKRRIRPVEFTEFFTKQGGVDRYFGMLFPYGWDTQQWAAYDHLMHQAIQAYLQSDGKLMNKKLSETGWHKQFEQNYSFITRNFIQTYWDQWLKAQWISNNDLKKHYDDYCITNGIQVKFRLNIFRLNQAIEEWATHHGILYDKDAAKRTNGILIRGKSFISMDETPF